MTGPHRFTESQIAEAKKRSSLVSLVGKRVALKKRGRDWWGLCPFHGEKSPSFKVDPKGFYKCHGCSKGGDAITWLQEVEGMTFEQAIKALLDDWVPRGVPMTPPAYAPKPVEDRESYLAAKELWDRAGPAKGTVVEDYLRGRGIKLLAGHYEHLRYAPSLIHSPTGRRYRGMVAQLTDDRGFCCVQRTFLLNDRPEKIAIPSGGGKNLPSKLTRGPMRGGAVRLGRPAGGMLGMAEGIETALSASQLYSLPVWATCGLSRFKGIELPKDIASLVIFGDPGDAGREAAFDAQDFYEQSRGFNVEVIFPQADFARAGLKDDFNDVLQAERTA